MDNYITELSIKDNLLIWLKNNNRYLEKSNYPDWCLKEKCFLIIFLCRQLVKNNQTITKKEITDFFNEENIFNKIIAEITLKEVYKELVYINSVYGWESGSSLYTNIIRLLDVLSYKENVSFIFSGYKNITFQPASDQDVMYIKNKVLCYYKEDINKINLVYEQISTEIETNDFEDILLIFISFNSVGGIEYRI